MVKSTCVMVADYDDVVGTLESEEQKGSGTFLFCPFGRGFFCRPGGRGWIGG